MRDYNAQSFLTSLIWKTRGERQCFQFAPRDFQAIAPFIAADVNAQISVISEAWAVPLFLANRDASEVRKEAALMQKCEAAHLKLLCASPTKARVRIWTMAEFIDSPMEPLQTIVDEISLRAMRRLTEAPRLVDLSGFGQFLQSLRNQGMQPTLMGDFPVRDDQRPPTERRARPYLVK